MPSIKSTEAAGHMSIWSHLHTLPHIDQQLSHVSNEFVQPNSANDLYQFNTNSYQQSIQMFAIIPIFIAFVYIVVSCVLWCIGCNKLINCNKNKTKNSIPSAVSAASAASDVNSHSVGNSFPSINNINVQDAPLLIDYLSPSAVHNRHVYDIENEFGIDKKIIYRPFAMYCRFLMSLLVLISIFVSLYYGYLLNNTITHIEDNFEYTYQPYDTSIHYGKEIETTIEDAITQCNEIILTPNASSLYPYVNLTRSMLKSADNYVGQYLGEAQKVSWGQSKDIDKYRKIVLYCGIGVLSFCALMMLVSICNKRKRSNTMKKILSIILGCGLFIIWIIASIEFSASVEISDVCNNPDKVVLNAVNSSLSSSKRSNTTWAIIKYYIYCDNKQPNNPLLAKTNLAYNDLAPLNQTIEYLVSESGKYGIKREADQLDHDYDKMLLGLQYLNDSLQCDDINEYYTDIKHGMCIKMVNEWFILYCLQFFIVILLVLRECFKCQVNYNKNKHKYQVVMENDDSNDNNFNNHNNNNNNNNNNIHQRNNQSPFGMAENDVGLEDVVGISSINDIIGNNVNNDNEIFKKRKESIKEFSDGDYKKCLKYLSQFSDDNERKEKCEMLKEIGYPESLEPLSDELVDKSMAIIRNAERNKDSKHKHPLLDGITL